MKEVLISKDRCKACGLCIHRCPKSALSLSDEINSVGYHFTEIDKEKCIVCGICYQVCPDGVFEVRK